MHRMNTQTGSPDPSDEPEETISNSGVARSPESQGSNVPLGWKPTKNEPVPVVRCTTIKKNGERCKQWSLRGTTVCIAHGGRLPVVQDHAAAVVESAKLRLIGLADAAVTQLEDLMLNAAAEQVRLKASTEVLDRAGVKGPIEVDVTVTQSHSPVDRVNERLAGMARRISADQTVSEEPEEIVVEEDDPTEENETP